MKKISVVPLESVNDVDFGTEREIVRNSFGKFKEFKKSPLSKNTSDAFEGLHIFYDCNNRFEAIEFFEVEVFVGNVRFLPSKISDVAKVVLDLVSDESEYWVSREQSIGIYAPNKKIESILFGIADYYN